MRANDKYFHFRLHANSVQLSFLHRQLRVVFVTFYTTLTCRRWCSTPSVRVISVRVHQRRCYKTFERHLYIMSQDPEFITFDPEPIMLNLVSITGDLEYISLQLGIQLEYITQDLESITWDLEFITWHPEPITLVAFTDNLGSITWDPESITYDLESITYDPESITYDLESIT